MKKNVNSKISFFTIPGEFHNVPLVEQMIMLNENYGDVVKLEGLLFRKPMVILFKPEYCERMYRLETRQPRRESMEALHYYRQANKHIFQKPGLATRLYCSKISFFPLLR